MEEIAEKQGQGLEKVIEMKSKSMRDLKSKMQEMQEAHRKRIKEDEEMIRNQRESTQWLLRIIVKHEEKERNLKEAQKACRKTANPQKAK